MDSLRKYCLQGRYRYQPGSQMFASSQKRFALVRFPLFSPRRLANGSAPSTTSTSRSLQQVWCTHGACRTLRPSCRYGQNVCAWMWQTACVWMQQTAGGPKKAQCIWVITNREQVANFASVSARLRLVAGATPAAAFANLVPCPCAQRVAALPCPGCSTTGMAARDGGVSEEHEDAQRRAGGCRGSGAGW